MGHDSDKLIRFGYTEPPDLTTKDEARKTLKQQVDEYLANGGQITPCDDSAGVTIPVWRSRRSHINFMKRRDFQRRKNPKK